MSLKKWHELPVELRRSKSKRWDYLVNELTNESESNDSDSNSNTVYDFTSYDSETKDTEYATGTAQPTGNTNNGFSEIEVLTNSEESFVGNKYYITSDANADGETAYQLFSDAGVTGTGIYVTISVHE